MAKLPTFSAHRFPQIFEANKKQMHFYLAKPWQTSFESEKISYGFEELF